MQIIIPELTESYSSQADPPERGIPMCTLHHFPSVIDHTCMWARDIFTGLFEIQPQSVNTFLEGKLDCTRLRTDDPSTLLATLKATKEYMVTGSMRTFDDCIRWAREKFEELFNFNIRDLNQQFPRDAKTSEGLPFWGGAKRYPSPAAFDPNNEYHAQFVTAAATIRARVFGIPLGPNIPAKAAAITPGVWRFGGVKVTVDTSDKTGPARVDDDDFASIDTLIRELSPFVGNPRRFAVEEFEKDREENGHMAFIGSAANIRAINYQIPPQDAMTIKRIAGNIIPAIATTTAMICGFVALEMYKVHAIVPKKVTDFRFGTVNLAINMYAMSEPVPCPTRTVSVTGAKFTLWTTWLIEGDLTVGQFIEAVRAKHGVELEAVMAGSLILFADYLAYTNPKLTVKVSKLLVDSGQPPLAPGQNLIHLIATASDSEGNEVDLPEFDLKVR
jgi:ubiquitin-activating enzyme E1